MRRPRGPVPDVTIACAGLVGSSGDAPTVLLRRRPAGGLLGGMWEVPGEEVGAASQAARAAREVAYVLTGRMPDNLVNPVVLEHPNPRHGLS